MSRVWIVFLRGFVCIMGSALGGMIWQMVVMMMYYSMGGGNMEIRM